MRIGGFFSFVAHGVIIATGLLAAPSGNSDDAEAMPVIDIDLVTISDETDLAAITKDAELDEKAEEAQQEEYAAAAAPPPKPEDTVALDEPEARPPPKPKEKTFEEELAALTAAIPNKEPQRARDASSNRSANLNNIPDAGSRPGAGRKTGNSVTIAAYIASQLVTNRCWTDHSDMADAKRLSTTFRVRFGRNGKFLSEPQMIDPPRPPSSDPPLQVYIQHGITALNKCNTDFGFKVPTEYFELPTSEQYLDLRLLPQIAAMK
jgi:hypothetical protein